MPYSGIEPGSETEKRLEICVEKVLSQHEGEENFGKSNAIAICRKSMEANTMEAHGLTLLPVTETDLQQWGHNLTAEAIKGELVKATNVVLAHAERNANGDGITAENIATLASTLNLKPLDLDHKQTEVIGFFVNPRQQDWGDVVGGELATDLVVFAGRFPGASEDLQTGTRYPSIEARSSEVMCSICDQWFQSTADYCEHLTPLLMGNKLGANVTRWHKNMKAIGGGAVLSPAGAETTFGNAFMVVAHVTDDEEGVVDKAGKETIDVMASQEVIMPDELKEAREQLETRVTELAVATTRIEELEATNTKLVAEVQEHVTKAMAFIVKSRVATLAASGMSEDSLKQINDRLADMDDAVFDMLAEMQKALSAKPAKVEAGKLTIGDEEPGDPPPAPFSVFDVEVVQ